MTTTADRRTELGHVDLPATSVLRGSGYRLSVLLGAALSAPAVLLVLHGNLSVNDALVRFGCALVFAAAGLAVVLATLPSHTGPGDAPGAAAPAPEPPDAPPGA